MKGYILVLLVALISCHDYKIVSVEERNGEIADVLKCCFDNFFAIKGDVFKLLDAIKEGKASEIAIQIIKLMEHFSEIYKKCFKKETTFFEDIGKILKCISETIEKKCPEELKKMQEALENEKWEEVIKIAVGIAAKTIDDIKKCVN